MNVVYLVWFRSWEFVSETLIGCWQTETDARMQSEYTATVFANGSGHVTESLMGDSWDVRDRERKEYRVRLEAVTFGVLTNRE